MKSSKPARALSGSNPLRALRELLGSDAKRLSTYKLSGLVGIPSATLRSIEAGRNAFTDALQQRLRRRGIGWNPKTKRWFFAFNPALPLSVDLIIAYNRLSRPPDPLFQDIDADMVCRGIVALLHAVPTSEYNNLILHLRDSLEGLRQQYHVEGIEKILADMTPKYSWDVTRSGARVLAKGYSGPGQGDPENLLDLRELRKWTPPGEAQAPEEVQRDVA
jgi:hypothetical protein